MGEGIKLGICAWVLPGKEQEAFEIASNVGLDGVVINYGQVGEMPFLSSEMNQRHYKELMEKHQLVIPTIALNLFCKKGMYQKENKTFAIEVFKRAVDIAVAMGINSVQVPSFYNNLPNADDDLKRTIEILHYATELARQGKVIIGTENVFTVEQTDKVFKAINSPNLANLFDTANPYQMANQVGPEIAKGVLDYTSELHFKEFCDDCRRDVRLGEGDVAFNEAVKVFVDNGFTGWVQLESAYNSMEDYEMILRDDITIARNLFEK